MYVYNHVSFCVSGYKYLILVGIVATFLIIIIIGATVGILKLIDRNKEREAARRQLLQNIPSQEYATGNQMTMRPIYRERAEMVPDILENSLPRPQPVQYAPASESSYGTNYPGTMYYMGPQGPQYHVYEQYKPMDYESVTLPKKPETVSDSESEDMYATIPADE